ncbi:helix-turn-helix domain-containing protein [Pseudoroseicyclus sp. CXY001]|uniref:helix-turn-helix domain-containing protein n=1 Tax=Pseudoroseicyclus sp. CXY001 TaxID=3242492 RepID=UPI003570C1DF
MNALAQYLAANCIRQTPFAERCGTTQATISRLSAGTSLPSLDLAIRIEDATAGAVPANSWRNDASAGGAAPSSGRPRDYMPANEVAS